MYPFDSAGYTPLHYACLYNNIEVAMLLVKHGSDIYMKNREGNDALEICLNLNHETGETASRHEEIEG